MLLHASQDIIFAHWPILAGVAAAFIHVFTGPDHLAAVLPFVVDYKGKAWKIGMSWGVGHLAGMLLIGVLFMLFNKLLPLEQFSHYSEVLVGFILVFIGVWSVYRVRNSKTKHQHPHFHEESNEMHIHPHVHSTEHVHSHPHPSKKSNNMLSSMLIGVLHGFAGVAHFILFLPMLSFTSTLQSVSYIGGFGIGTIGAMTAFSIAMGIMSSKARKFSIPITSISYTAASIAIVVGVYWIFSV